MKRSALLDRSRSLSRFRATISLSLLATACVVVSGCGGGKSEPKVSERQVGPTVVDSAVTVKATGEFDPIANPAAIKGGAFFVWGGEYPHSLNMWLDYNSFSASITGLMFESLMELHSTKDDPRGVLAESWEISDDKRTFTFKIRPDAVWSDGKPITAEDFQFYYDVIMNPKNLTSLFRVDLSRFSRPEVIDAKTVRITAETPHWNSFWVAGGLVALPKHVWGGRDFNEINFEFPVVSGPYRLFETSINRSITMQRRGDWWGRHERYNQHKFNFDYLVYRAVDDRNKALEMLKRGDYDSFPVYTARIWAQETNFPQVKKNWVVRQLMYNREPKAFQGFAMNMRRPNYQDPRVREALAHLLNRELMIEKLMFNEYILLNSYYPDLYENNRGPAPMLKFDPARARQLLAEAGWKVDTDGVLKKDGRPFELVFLHHGEPLPHLTIFLEDLKSVGIQGRIDNVSQATATKRVQENDFDLVWRNWSAGRLRDPENMWYSKTADEIATQNIAGVKSPEIDALIEKQRLEFDLGKRNEILLQIDRELIKIQPYILLWQSDRNRMLYWNRFGITKTGLDKFNREDVAPIYWWFDPQKSARLDEAMSAGRDLPAEPAELHYQE